MCTHNIHLYVTGKNSAPQYPTPLMIHLLWTPFTPWFYVATVLCVCMQRLRANRSKLISFRTESKRMSKSLLVWDNITLYMFHWINTILEMCGKMANNFRKRSYHAAIFPTFPRFYQQNIHSIRLVLYKLSECVVIPHL